MDSHFSHLLLPITLAQDLNKLLFCFFADVHTKSPVRVLAPEERFPAVVPLMKITASAVPSWIADQFAVCLDDNTNKVFLIVLITAAQTRSLRTMFTPRQRGLDHQSLVIPSAGSDAASAGDTASDGADSSACSAALAFSSSAFKRFSATYSLADLCSDSAFS